MSDVVTPENLGLLLPLVDSLEGLLEEDASESFPETADLEDLGLRLMRGDFPPSTAALEALERKLARGESSSEPALAAAAPSAPAAAAPPPRLSSVPHNSCLKKNLTNGPKKDDSNFSPERGFQD